MSTFEAPPSADALRDLRELSPFPGDEGELIGRDPREVSPEILSIYHMETNPLRALRERCLDCCCGSASEVRKCSAVTCPSWPFRMGRNPFRKKSVLSPERRQAAAERFARARLHAADIEDAVAPASTTDIEENPHG
jgi:hypothetical protein